MQIADSDFFNAHKRKKI